MATTSTGYDPDYVPPTHQPPAALCHGCLRWRPAESVELQDRGEGEVQVCARCSRGESLPTLTNPAHLS